MTVKTKKRLSTYPGLFGDGSDGVVDLDGTNTYAGFATKAGSVYTLTRPVYATNLTIRYGSTLKPNGYGVYCTGIWDDQAGSFFEMEGNAAVANVAGAALNTGVFAGGFAGGAGGAVATGGAAGVVSTNGLAGAGGNGGAGGGGAAAGAGGLATVIAIAYNWRTPAAFHMGGVQVNAFIYQFKGGAGGGGGGGGAANLGGGGGSGGGILVIMARIVIHNGTWRVRGGAGGTPASGNGGGGGGGGGGTIYVMCAGGVTGAGTTQYTGGAKGLHGPTGGSDGVDGAVGGLYVYDVAA